MTRDDGDARPTSGASRNLSQRRLLPEDPHYRENSPRGVRDRAGATLGLCLAVVVCCGSCAHLGPRTIPVDRFDYSTAVGESWKEQALLNIVKMRYADLPTFVDVSSIVSGYSLQTGVNVGGTVSSQKAVQGNFVTAGAQAIYTDRPTITYLPLTGERFLRGLLMPIDPKNIFFLLQSGYTVDFMGLTVESLNGVRNRSVTGGTIREADPDFVRVLQLLSEIQAAGVVGMRVDEDKARGSIGVLLFRRADLPTDLVDKAAEVRRLLKLSPDREQFVLTYSPTRGAENELAVNSRSMLQIMAAFSSYLDAPEEHLRDHSALPSPEPASQASGRDGVRIRSGKDKPAHAFVAVPYRDYWFWIDDGDLITKRALMAINFFFTLAETGAADRLPLVTIPAQ